MIYNVNLKYEIYAYNEYYSDKGQYNEEVQIGRDEK